ncbi:MAG: hypothetical protein HY208_07130 [Nitrospirae bacterium]|nr:hypothetical protein [Nitrospirota bacterium]
MKAVLIGGGEPGLHLLSWLNADPSTRVLLVIEPDRRALIYQVETLGFRWSDSGGPPLIRDSVEALAELEPPDLVIASIQDDALLRRVQAMLPSTALLLRPEDLAICRRLRAALQVQANASSVARPLSSSASLEDVGDQEGADEEGDNGEPARGGIDQFELFLERLTGGAPWPLLLERMTWWMQWLSGSSACALFVHRGWGRRLLLERARGLAASGGERLFYAGLAQQAVDRQRMVHCVQRDDTGRRETLTAVPMVLEERPVGVMVLARPSLEEPAPSPSDQFALSWLAIRLAGALCRGMQLEWARESGVRDRIRRGIKEVIGRELPAGEACRLGVEMIADQLSAASCRLYRRGPRASGWVACASAPTSRASWAPTEHPWRGTVMLTAASLEPLLLVQEPQKLLYLPFDLGTQGDGVLVIEHPDAETWSVQLVELLKEMGQLMGAVAQRAGEERP